MKQRCENPNNKAYQSYGGRGITVCARWQNFENFIADVGLRPSELHSLDREKNSGNYEPGNCRWATARQQMRNTRLNFIVTAFGRTEPLVCFIPQGSNSAEYQRAHNRIRRGWSAEAAIATPSQRGGA